MGLDQMIQHQEIELQNLTGFEKENARYTFITSEELKSLKNLKNKKYLIIKPPEQTKIEISHNVDKKICLNLSNPNEPIKIFMINPHLTENQSQSSSKPSDLENDLLIDTSQNQSANTTISPNPMNEI